MNLSSLFRKKSLILVLSYAPIGLGHLRVTQALYQGLPKDITPVLLGSQDKSISIIYRIISSNPIARILMEYTQNGFAHDIFTVFYRYYLRNDTNILKKQLLTLLEQRIDLPETLLVVATHYALAHQLAAIKEEFAKKYDIDIILVVQVTDDSPQSIWYVYGVDMVFVPSEQTKRALTKYGKREHLPQMPIMVNGYPISPLLAPRLTNWHYEERKDSLTYHSHKRINIAIPISGAAVWMQYYTELINELHQGLQRATFHIVAKSAKFTEAFLADMFTRSYVKIETSAHDRGVVDLYEKLYTDTTIDLEITKPSEQAFKALFTPKQVGGSILLFASPIGRQEYDNLAFMRRHGLIPTKQIQQKLFSLASKNSLLLDDKEYLLAQAKSWRGLMLPKQSADSSQFIIWCLREGIFSAMVEYQKPVHMSEAEKIELSDDGVKTFWHTVGEMLEEAQN